MADPFRFITFLSDYGLEDEFVGVCRGVIKRFAPDVEILDIAHGIPPQDVAAGATVLAQAVAYMPPAVHMAIVDPGVGTDRLAVVIETKEGSPLIGPNNGLLSLAADVLGGATAAVSIENDTLFLAHPSHTFHGRDIFAPVAARVAMGIALDEIGPRIDVGDLVRIHMPAAQVDDDHIHARIAQIDHFGNLQLNVHRSELEGVGVMIGDELQIRVGGRSFTAPFGEAFSEVASGKLVLIEDSYRWLTVAVNRGSARDSLEARRGDPVILARVQRAAASR